MAGGSFYRAFVEFVANTASFESGVQRMEKHMGRFSKQVDSMARNAKSAFAKLGIGFSLVGLARMGITAIQTGDDLAKAAVKSGIAANAFTELAFAARMSDLDLAQLSTGLKKMQVELSKIASEGGYDENLAALGLSIKDIVALEPDKQFELIADAISRLKSPADRTRAAVAFFGKAGADLLPMFEQGAEGIRKAREEAKRFGASLSEADLQKFRDADQALKEIRESADSLKRSLAIGLAPAIQAVADKFAILSGTAGELQKLRERLRFLEQLGDLGGLNIGNYIAGAGLVITAAERDAFISKYRKRLEELLADAAATPISGDTPPGFIVELPEIVVKGKDWAKEQAEAAKEWAAEIARIAGAYQEVYESGSEAIRALESPGERILRNFEEQRYALEQLAATYPAFADAAQEALERLVATTQEQLDELARVPPEAEKANDSMTVFAEQAARNMQDAFADFLFDPMDKGFKGMVKGFADALRRMLAEFMASQLFKYIGGALAGKGGWIGAFGDFLSGKRALGGPVSGGRPYLVGERGPELFVPGSSGAITPNNRLGGVTLAPVYNIDARGATTDLVRALPGILQENNRRLMEAWNDRRLRGAFA